MSVLVDAKQSWGLTWCADCGHCVLSVELCGGPREGLAIAIKAKGVHFGRTAKDRGEGYETVMATWRRGKISDKAAARALGVAPGTFRRWCRR